MAFIPTQNFLTIDEKRIHLIEKNDTCEQTIVFIHGRCLSVKSWERQFDSELLADFRLIAFDLPGHGLSATGQNPTLDYSLQGYIRTLANVIEQLELTKFFLVGNSLGGHIALEAMPHLTGCQGAFVMTMPITKPMRFDKMYLNGELLGKVYTETPDQNDISVYAKSLLRPHADEFPAYLVTDFLKTDPRVHQGIVHGILANEYDDEVHIIRAKKRPVAIILGEQEQVHNLSYLDDFTLLVWRGGPLLVPDAGHLPQWENPAVVNQLLNLFIEDCTTASRRSSGLRSRA